MAISAHVLASGLGWSVSDVVCTAGPRDRPVPERHDAACIAAVTRGTFQYRSALGAAVLAPGALLLGNRGTAYECGHEHATGDRCLAFHFTAEHLEEIVAAVPGAQHLEFAAAALPPLPRLVPLIAAAEAARDDAAALEELALRLPGAVAAALAGSEREAATQSPHDERCITRALRRIEANANEPLTLAELAREAAMSRYHFLRTFRRLIGMTPHQFVLRTRLARAAVRLRRTPEPIAVIAFETGFNDLSTFNRRFRQVMGVHPGAYRALRSGAAARR
jgi:AraC family transcriptional regulator